LDHQNRCNVCGIVGFIDSRPERGPDELRAVATAMADRLRHRGPDDSGSWSDATAGIALAHRRLSILDLSPDARQPMLSSDGRHVLTYNGELYNYRELRRQLEGSVRFRTTSDTEVVVEAIARWGVLGALQRFNGMFALAVWDRRELALWIARDRLGEKPLYYGSSGGTALFASEPSALRAHPAFTDRLDLAGLRAYFRYGHVPAPLSVFEGIRKLPPASLAVLRSGHPEFFPPERYWHPDDVAPAPSDPSDALGRLEDLLHDSVRLRLASDVPLGAFLSGGIDSSLVTAVAQAESASPLKTFSIGFAEAAFDEAPFARAVAAHLGTDHTEWEVTATEAQQVIPRLPAIYDEPFADSSQIPTVLVSELARRDVTVVLSGDGGDELFCGYRRYVDHARTWRPFSLVPHPLRRAAGAACALATVRRPRVAHPPYRFRGAPLGAKLDKLATLLPLRGPDDLDEYLRSVWQRPEELVIGAPRVPARAVRSDGGGSFVETLMAGDLEGFLPDDILVKVDRATMSVGLEGRMPLLDHRIVELASGMPLSMKTMDGAGKWPLRQILGRHVPASLVDRPKQGFEVPVGQWITGGLRPWAEELLDGDRMRRDAVIEPAAVRRAWDDHLAGTADNTACLWAVLMFNAWLDDRRSSAATP
jgi:asparagine synthase (glutamine-hydrolysing)